ncbi:MAG TPA: FAD-linked oxidase C-terminal domain-containing protein, partial [Thermoanaerobaculia bacterium]|nr:FAD-linked oxidase C-terminal domain-containing protein [Thermoanaerobaculia bacterium]
ASVWTREPPKSWPGDARALGDRLARSIAGEVRFDAGHRALYAVDGSNYRQVPIGVLLPRTLDDVLATVELCRDAEAPLLNRGGGTSLCGQCCNLAVVVDWSRHLRGVVEVDRERRLARVQPGLVLDVLRRHVAPHELTFGPDPATHSHCTLGGMLGNDSCGVHSVLAGRTEANVLGLDVLTYDGVRLRVGPTPPEELAAILAGAGRRAEIYRALASVVERYGDEIRRRFPDIPRRVSGYNLPALLPENGFDVGRLLVGSEGTLVTILEATLRLVPWPAARSLVVVGFADVYAAAAAVPAVLALGPIGLEGLDDRLILDNVAKGLNAEGRELLPRIDDELGGAYLLVEFGGATQPEADAEATRGMRTMRELPGFRGQTLLAPPQQQRVWELRESGLGATARVPGKSDTWEGWEDSAVPPERLAGYLRDLRALYESYGYRGSFYGHFGQGCVHTRISFDLYTAAGIDKYHRFVEEAADLCVAYGGSLSGEHGDGQSRGELLPRMFGEELLGAFRAVKAAFDPEGRMNPGKVVDPYPITSNLRLGPEYRPAQPKTVFAFADDDGSLARATMRCVGVGKCRRLEGGTMCPSYRVTLDERHSTRGRAHLLHEMLVGEAIRDGWRSREVKEALDLCLACKGCKSDCPVGVDMATYKAEFLHHYYRRRLRPRAAYAMGLIPWWARIASKAPRLVNALMAAPGISRVLKAAAGIASERAVPKFATTTFRDWMAKRRPASGDATAASIDARARSTSRGGEGRADRPPVLLYADTFTNFFDPEIGEAAVEVLEAAGFRVELPKRLLCCGRSLYDYGFLNLAKRLLRRNIDELRETVRAGVPIVGLEPSCVATFRDELPGLFPDDSEAQQLSRNVFTLAELLQQHAPEWQPPHLAGNAVVHGHCHHKAVMGVRADRDLLAKTGLDVNFLDAGCCGLAGSFGFESEHYEISIACGEQALLPAMRTAGAETLVLADGFSCRNQIAHGSRRRALHLAQLLRE